MAGRHLENNALALYDMTSRYFEGRTCPLVALGHNRDGKKGEGMVRQAFRPFKTVDLMGITVIFGISGILFW